MIFNKCIRYQFPYRSLNRIKYTNKMKKFSQNINLDDKHSLKKGKRAKYLYRIPPWMKRELKPNQKLVIKHTFKRKNETKESLENLVNKESQNNTNKHNITLSNKDNNENNNKETANISHLQISNILNKNKETNQLTNSENTIKHAINKTMDKRANAENDLSPKSQIKTSTNLHICGNIRGSNITNQLLTQNPEGHAITSPQSPRLSTSILPMLTANAENNVKIKDFLKVKTNDSKVKSTTLQLSTSTKNSLGTDDKNNSYEKSGDKNLLIIKDTLLKDVHGWKNTDVAKLAYYSKKIKDDLVNLKHNKNVTSSNKNKENHSISSKTVIKSSLTDKIEEKNEPTPTVNFNEKNAVKINDSLSHDITWAKNKIHEIKRKELENILNSKSENNKNNILTKNSSNSKRTSKFKSKFVNPLKTPTIAGKTKPKSKHDTVFLHVTSNPIKLNSKELLYSAKNVKDPIIHQKHKDQNTKYKALYNRNKVQKLKPKGIKSSNKTKSLNHQNSFRNYLLRKKSTTERPIKITDENLKDIPPVLKHDVVLNMKSKKFIKFDKTKIENIKKNTNTGKRKALDKRDEMYRGEWFKKIMTKDNLDKRWNQNIQLETNTPKINKKFTTHKVSKKPIFYLKTITQVNTKKNATLKKKPTTCSNLYGGFGRASTIQDLDVDNKTTSKNVKTNSEPVYDEQSITTPLKSEKSDLKQKINNFIRKTKSLLIDYYSKAINTFLFYFTKGNNRSIDGSIKDNQNLNIPLVVSGNQKHPISESSCSTKSSNVFDRLNIKITSFTQSIKPKNNSEEVNSNMVKPISTSNTLCSESMVNKLKNEKRYNVAESDCPRLSYSDLLTKVITTKVRKKKSVA